MRKRSLLILIVLAAAMAGYILFYERHQASTDERLELAEMVFPELDQDEVVAVDIRSPLGSVRLEKHGDDWRLSDPVDDRADSAAVKIVLRSLARLKIERRLSEEEIDRSVYNLDEPEIRVVLTGSDGTIFQLSVGDETPLGSSRAVATGEPGVLLCSSFFIDNLLKETDDWRSRSVVEISESSVASMTLTADEDRLHVVRIGDRWSLLEPVQDIADADHMRQMTADLDSLEIADFIDLDEADSDLGLDVPRFTLTILRREGDAPTVLEFGSTRDEQGITQVVCRRDGADVFWVNDTILTPLAKAPVRWRAPKVWPFHSWDVEKISLTRAEISFTVDRGDGMWRLEQGDADYAAIEDLLGNLSGLEARSYDLMKPATAERGGVELVFRSSGDEDESETVVFSFFEPLTKGGRAMVTVSGRDSVMSVDLADLEEILVEEQTLRTEPPTEEPPPVLQSE